MSRYRLKEGFSNPIGDIQETKKSTHGILFSFPFEKGKVEFMREDVVRIKISQGGIFDEKPSAAVLNQSPRCKKFTCSDSKNEILLKTSVLNVKITKKTFNIAVSRTDGSMVFEGFSGDSPDDMPYRVLNRNWAFKIRRHPQDMLLGLGEKTGPVNKTGKTWQMWNLDILSADHKTQVLDTVQSGTPESDPTGSTFDPYYISIPFFYRVNYTDFKAAGFYFDNPYRGYFNFDGGDSLECEFCGGQMTLYVFAGPSMPDILEAYTELTGRMKLPPLWSLGHHHCRWHVYTDADVRSIASLYREHRIPCDSFWLDIDYMDGYRVFTWNKKRFPNIKKLTDELLKKDFRTVTIVDPGVKNDPSYPACKEGLEQGHFCRTPSGNCFVGGVWPGQTFFPDFSRESTRKWWARMNSEHIRAAGLAGIWNDMNEPIARDADYDDMCFDTEGKMSPHDRYHNEYALLMAMSTEAGFADALPDKRPFILSRAGSPGIQRYAANWMGDNMSKWEHLQMSISMGCGLSISGQPFVGSDVGGFGMDTEPELMIRWMQYAALTPFFRNHNSSQRAQEPWMLGDAALELIRQAISFRYRLMPYIYTAFLASSERGISIQTPLAFAYQNDYAAYFVNDEFLFGQDILVAPVYNPGAVGRRVYLPSGEWYDLRSDRLYRGAAYIDAEAPLDSIPVFAKAGKLIPMLPETIQSTANWKPEMIELHFMIPSFDGEFSSRVWEDDGESLAYKHGKYLDSFFIISRKGTDIKIHTETSGDSFPQFVRKGFRLVFHGNPDGLRISWNGKICKDGDIVG